ncbi:MAG: helix-turn-helix transcriptional regulator [Firmicutes bacterium]|nr:helix-turn-helix transcriptional regulator [Bacillota bacterium]
MNKSRWDEILSVAARLFREKGYRATTMEDIASCPRPPARSGAPPASL